MEIVKSNFNPKLMITYLFLFWVLLSFGNSHSSRDVNLEHGRYRLDSLVSLEAPFFIFVSDEVDSMNNEVILKYDYLVSDHPPPPPSGRNFCTICIVNPDSIIILGELIMGFSDYYEYLLSYYDYMNNTDAFDHYFFDIEMLGNVEATNLVFEIKINSNANNHITATLLRTIMSSLDGIFNLFENKRNKYAIEFFNRNFKELDYNEKSAILYYRPLDIRIIFNSHCGIIKPPPPAD